MMLPNPLEAAERRAEALSHRLALRAAGAACVAAGAGFLTLAAWLVLAAQGSPLYAATVIGAVYAGLGLLLWAIAPGGGARQNTPQQAEPDPYGPFFQMAEGFAVGMEAGRAARRPEAR
ncbi:hypothetical protein Ga0609869_001569 [Rhodovulum iodosum]|uniref:Superfamily III holin-X n=1 Tax=Rhodovulum iodosum TaxID=68291 RepID=A0ABV3XSA4_9RHOB|nr:hypothetical protein [Rhodovulum robiginosum]RSK30541.1 hypothetical protein EJA01_17380 [Rhodovulum robiginosum]